jgi:outer membrane lipoprotein
MRIITLIALLLIMSGCGSVISKGLLKEVNRDLTIEAVQSAAEQHLGQRVLWGGVIITSENLAGATEVEVLETPLSWLDTPTDPVDGGSGGRFIIKAEKYLDIAIFSEGRLITVAGAVKGVVTRKIGMMDYRYPVITPIELKLFDPYKESEYRYDPWADPFYSPFYYGGYPGYPYDPWYPGYPFNMRRHRHRHRHW